MTGKPWLVYRRRIVPARRRREKDDGMIGSFEHGGQSPNVRHHPGPCPPELPSLWTWMLAKPLSFPLVRPRSNRAVDERDLSSYPGEGGSLIQKPCSGGGLGATDPRSSYRFRRIVQLSENCRYVSGRRRRSNGQIAPVRSGTHREMFSFR